MISNHYPFLSSGPSSWIIVGGIFVVGFLVRHFFNLEHAGRTPQWWLWPAAAAMTVGLLLLTLPRSTEAVAVQAAPVGFPEVQRIVATRCQVCHSAAPRFQGMSAPPKGIMFDSPTAIAALAPQIYVQAVASHAMPLNNLTGITDDERRELGAWISSGSKLQ
jgi:uncharacterized membrane protein